MARILVAEDDAGMQLAIGTALGRAGHEVVTVPNGKAALETAEEGFALVVSDERMPVMTGTQFLSALRGRGSEVPFVMMTAHGTVSDAVAAMQAGASDFIQKPFSAEDLCRVVDRLVARGEGGPAEPGAGSGPRARRAGVERPIVTSCPVMKRVLEVAEAVARSDATVLVQGESGTGKELVARLVHAAGGRRGGPFVAVNCAALPESLLESELFGHEKGAFTGAQVRKVGKFELAHGGTILLDEVSEMDVGLQAKLLRVLQEREVDRVGGRDPVRIDVRVVATTNRNLEEHVAAGKFRADLYYRLNVIPLTVPPLRARKGDVALLARHFMREFLGKDAPPLSPDVSAELERHPWPGNVRELRNAVERAAILSRGAVPRREDFLLGPPAVAAARVEATSGTPRPDEDVAAGVGAAAAVPSAAAPDPADDAPLPEPGFPAPGTTVHEMEKRLILETLRSTGNNRTHAAKLLGISIRTLRNKLHEYRGDDPETGESI